MLGNTAFSSTPFADIQQGTFLSSEVDEFATARSTVSSQQNFVDSVTELVVGSNSQTKTLTIPVAISETVAGSAAAAGLLQMGMQVNEANTFEDIPSSQADYVANAVEATTVQDASTGTFILYEDVVEQVAVAEEETRRLLWENIDDSQNPSWTNIE